MGARRAFPLTLLALVACTGVTGAREDTGFHVVSSLPTDGSDDVVESQTPELRLSAEADPEACTGESVGLVAVNEDGSVAFELPVTVELLDGGNKLGLDHAEPFTVGYSYGFVVRTGDTVCRDVDGRPLRAFHAEFEVR
ncbi:MAG TPA: hypothetical protein QGF58_21050 [Myxococcota bacterium]|nr:hypothetical protein [Myxococcota bacterium]